MSSPRKLTLILMHDDGKTHRLRLSRKFFLFLTTLLVLLPVLGGLGIWTGWETWTAWQAFDQQRVQMQRELNDWRMQAERLSNMMQLAGLQVPAVGSVPPASLLEGLQPAAVPAKRNTNSGLADAKPAGAAPALPSAPSLPPSPALPSSPALSPSPTLPAALKPHPEAQTASGNGTATATGNASSNATTPVTAESTAEHAADPREDEENNVDMQVVRLENVISRVQTGRKLRIALDLYNAKPMAGQVGGRFLISLIDPNGKILPIQHEEGTFRISRFKKVIMQATLPDSVTAADNAALLITVIVDDEPVLRKIYQVESR